MNTSLSRAIINNNNLKPLYCYVLLWKTQCHFYSSLLIVKVNIQAVCIEQTFSDEHCFVKNILYLIQLLFSFMIRLALNNTLKKVKFILWLDLPIILTDYIFKLRIVELSASDFWQKKGMRSSTTPSSLSLLTLIYAIPPRTASSVSLLLILYPMESKGYMI